jgi:hypothetical protein
VNSNKKQGPIVAKRRKKKSAKKGVQSAPEKADKEGKNKAAAEPSNPTVPSIDLRELGAAVVIAAVAAACFVWPVLLSGDRWGINDWDQHQLYYGFARWSIADRGELPFWNPFMCGGNPALANPQSPWLHPLFALVLILGDLPGLKLLVWLHAALGALGAWFFGRRLGCSRIAAWLPAAAFGLGSTYALHVATGHSTWFAMAWLPFSLAALHAGFTRPYAATWAGAAAALVLYIGNANLFIWLFVIAAVWTTAETVARRGTGPLVAFAIMVAVGAGLAAVKLLPMAAFLDGVTTKEIADTSSGNWRMFWYALLGHTQTLRAYEGQIPGIAWRFWEYGAYVGPVVLLGAIGYLATRPRRAAPLAAVALASLWIALGHGYGPWDLLSALPGFSGIRVPSRAIAFAPLALATMAALWLSEWEKHLPPLAVAAGVALFAFDIVWVCRAPFNEAFVVAPTDVTRGRFQQVEGKKDFRSGWDRAARRYLAPYSDMYPAFLQGRGTVNCYDRLHLPIAAIPAVRRNGAANPLWRGEAWLEAGGTADLHGAGGRRLVVSVKPARPGRLVLNQNFAPGWRCLDGRRVIGAQGRLAVHVQPADSRVVFLYTPPYLGAGVTVTILSCLVIAAVPFVRRTRRQSSRTGPPQD